MQNMEIENTFWAELDEEICPCSDTGWADINNNWEQCPVHFDGQLHPESVALLMDDPKRMEEEERKSKLRYKIAKERLAISELSAQLRKHQEEIVRLDLELVNRTPTVRYLPAVITSLLKPDTSIQLEGMNDEQAP